MYRAIARPSDADRLLVGLLLEDLSYREIAAVLGTVGLALLFVLGLVLTVKKGRRRVREQIDPLLDGLATLEEDSAEAADSGSKEESIR
jgi:hypothetical protein